MEYFLGIIVFFTVLIIAALIDRILERRCRHDFIIIDTKPILYSYGPSYGQVRGWMFISKCSKCNKIKSKKLTY